MNKKVQIKKINYGIAFCVNDKGNKWIEVNKNLKNYPKLYKSTLLHEMKHFKSKNKRMDFWLDFKDQFNFNNGKEMFRFMWHNPKSLLAASPVLVDNRKWSVNWFMLLLDFMFISIIIGGILLL